jgi:hypothetical protein
VITTRSAPRRQLRTAIRPPAYGIETSEMDSTFDRAYWLAHCDGYRVDCGAGRLGCVERVLDDGVLAVRAGRLGRRLLLVPTSAVDAIVPRAEHIWLHSTTILGSEAPEAPR